MREEPLHPYHRIHTDAPMAPDQNHRRWLPRIECWRRGICCGFNISSEHRVRLGQMLPGFDITRYNHGNR